MWAGGLFVLGCVAGNLAGGRPAMVGEEPVVTAELRDGTDWNAQGVIQLALGRSLTIELAEPFELRALALQGDNDDSYPVESSLDGNAWQPIWTAGPRHDGPGLRTRHRVLDTPVAARFLRVRGQGGDGRFSVGALAAYCEVPADFPADPSPLSPIVFWRSLDDNQVIFVKGTIAAAGTVLLLLGAFLRWRRRETVLRRSRDALLVVLGGLAFLGWWNFGRFHYDDPLHEWDIYHYYIGAKYFPELGYSRMYECTTVAEAERLGAKSVEGRTITDLTTNHIVPAAPVVADPERCRGRFSPERWRDFVSDAVFFRQMFGEARWKEILHDHGYNGTPVWGMLGRLFASLGPASWGQIKVLALLDPLLLVVMWGFVVWAFGWRAACVALIYWGTNYPARYYWNGGAFLRQDWLAATVIAICLVKRDRPASGGAALAYATLLRIFPGFLFVGVLAKLVAGLVRERRLVVPRETRRFLGGALVTGVALLLLALAVGTASPAAVVEFADNSRKHLETPLTNNMGWKTVVAYENKSRASLAVRPGQTDAWEPWKEARRATFAARRPLFYAGIAAFLVLLGWAAARQPDWVALVLGVGVIPFAAELTCYYYSVFLAFALLWPRAPLVGVGLLAVSAASDFVLRFLTWEDGRYYDISLWFVVFVLGATLVTRLSETRS